MYRNLSVLLGGDLNVPSEKYLLEHYTAMDPDNAATADALVTSARQTFESDIAKACHHGSADFTDLFLRAVNALATVISSGDDEPHSHPRPDALGALGKWGRGPRPLLFSTELARSANENIKKPNELRARINALVAEKLAATTDAERQAAQDKLDDALATLERSVAVYGGRLVEAQHVAHIGSWEWDVAANSIWWSDEMYGVYGLPVGSAVTYERYIAMVHPEDRARVQEIVSRSGQTGEPFTFEHRAVTPDGTVRMLHSRGRVVSDEHGRPIRMLGIGHDITERKRAEEERLELVREQAARREAEEASRMKDHFLATLSHELRTPLNAILGWAQMLKDHALDETLRQRAVDAIQRNVTVQAQLVSDILDVARIRRIAEDFLPHVFEQFRQADPSITREHGGLGLGLAISHNLATLHGGTITAANRAQGGAVFTVRLPAAAVDKL